MKYQTEIDVAYCNTIQEVLEDLEKCGSPKIVGYEAKGPGGGNPCLILESDTKEHAIEVLRISHPDEGEDYLESLIKIV